MEKFSPQFEAVIIGASAGGMKALNLILPCLPADYSLPVIAVLHRHPSSDDYLIKALNQHCRLTVKEADEKETIKPGRVYLAPPNYHLLIEEDYSFSLSLEEPVNYTRPSIDVSFESAADVFGSRLVGIVLTGANNDGSRGLKIIKDRGGVAVVQDPETAESDTMPRFALKAARVDYLIPLDGIGPFLVELTTEPNKRANL